MRTVRKAFGAVALVVTLAFIGSCTTTQESSQATVDIAPKVRLRLPTHQPFGDKANAVQLVQAIYKDRTETFQAIITSKGDSMSLVMTAPNGPRIMSFDWKGERLSAKYEPIAPKGLSAEHMLADIITIYGPAELLRSSLVGGTLVLKPDGTREIDSAAGPVIRISFPGHTGDNPWNGRADLDNLAFGYRLEIMSQPMQ